MAAMGNATIPRTWSHFQNPIALGLTGLVKLCRGRRIVSIDTALIHLMCSDGASS